MKGIAFYDEDFFTIKHNYDLYAEEIRRSLMTNNNERLNQPYFGANLRSILFELADERSSESAKEQIKEQIRIYLPMLEVLTFDAEIKENSLYINIGFIEKGDPIEDERILTIEFENAGELIDEQ